MIITGFLTLVFVWFVLALVLGLTGPALVLLVIWLGIFAISRRY